MTAMKFGSEDLQNALADIRRRHRTLYLSAGQVARIVQTEQRANAVKAGGPSAAATAPRL